MDRSECWVDDIALKTAKRDGRILKNLIPQFQDDEDIVLAAVGSYASPRLKDDCRIVLAAIKRHGPAIMYASPRLYM